MITKTTTPIIEEIKGKKTATGIQTECRIFGFLLYRKKSFSPCRYGVAEYDLLNV